MPYEIETKDGIVVRNIPDDIPPDHPSIKAKVTNARQAAGMPQVSAADRAMADPTASMSGPERFAAGAGKALVDLGRGIAQYTPFLSNEDIAESKRLDAPLMNTGAGMAGNLAGNLALVATPAGAAKLAAAPRLAQELIAASTLPRGLAIGAGYGALTPGESAKERLINTGAGAAAGGVVPFGQRIVKGIGALVEPLYETGQNAILGRLLRQTAGPNAAAVEQRIAAARDLVPGSQSTLAEVAESPGIAALQRAAEQALPEEYGNRKVAQNIARLGAVRDIAGQPGERAAYEGLRDFMSGPLYEEAARLGIPKEVAEANQPLIQNLLERMPKGVKEHAQELARINGQTMGPEGSVRGLHWVKQGIDDLISGAPQTGMGQAMKRALLDYKRDLVKILGELSPKYAEAMRNYAFYSKQPNRMELGQALLDKLEPALMTGSNVPTRINAEALARALRQGDEFAQKALGFKGAKMANVLTDADMATLENVKKDLQRKIYAETAGRGVGSNTFQNLAQENILNQLGVSQLPQLLYRPTQLANYALRAIYGGKNEEMKVKLANALLNRGEGLRMMQTQAPDRARISRAIRTALQPLALSAPMTANAQ